jgi:endonuclease III related protein
MNEIFQTYKKFLNLYGAQGWWPLLDCNGCNPTKTGAIQGYHPRDYSYPKNNQQKFEIIVGAILTQNTSWTSVEKALLNLKEMQIIDGKKIITVDENKLKNAIMPAGYYNQKAKYLKNISDFFISLEGKTPSRNEILAVKGVGNETADSILLYAYKQPEFVVDSYTKRVFTNLRIISDDMNYLQIKDIFEKNLPRDFKIYQEYHALIVEHAKRINNGKRIGK